MDRRGSQIHGHAREVERQIHLWILQQERKRLEGQAEPGRVSRRLRIEDDLSSGQENLRGCHDLGSTQ